MHALLKIIFLKMLTVSLITGLLTLVILAAAPWLNRRYSPRWRYWVWLVFAFWLVAPLTLPADWSPLSFSIPDVALSQFMNGHIPADNDVSTLGTAWRENPQSDPEATLAAMAMTPLSSTENPALTEQPPEEVLTGAGFVNSGLSKLLSDLTLLDLLVILWLTGIVLFFTIRQITALRFRAMLRRLWRPCDSLEVINLVRRTMAEMDFHLEMDIRFSEDVHSPFVTGLFHPVLVLPERSYDPCLLGHIIRHELTHCRRRDLWYKLVVDTANALHWFNPLIYKMNHVGDSDLELTCDELVIHGQDMVRRQEYGESILLTVKPGIQRLPALTTSFSARAKDLQKRFESIATPTGKRGGANMLALTLLLAVLLGNVAQISPANTNLETDRIPGNTAFLDSNRIFRLEGENHTAINHAAYYGLSSAASEGKFLQIYNEKGPEEGYLISYNVDVLHAGRYQMEICSTPHTTNWTSPYEVSVNNGDYVDVNSGTSEEIGIVSEHLRRYILTVVLEKGTNTITFRVTQPQKNDGYYTFFLDYLEFIPMDRVGARVEGEDPARINEDVPSKASTACSRGMYLHIYDVYGPNEGYLIDYEVSVAQEGAFWMEICSTPHTTNWTSPYEVSVNGGAFVPVNDDTAKTVSRVTRHFTRYTFPVNLQEGLNTITFRIVLPQKNDGHYTFFLDYMEIYN